MKTEDLLKGLDGTGLSRGQVFKRSIVNSLALEFKRQCVSQGRYGNEELKVTSEDEPENEVSLNIVIDEGEVAEIKTINVGNLSFSDEDIFQDFELTTGGWFSFFTNDNRYSREKLKGDIESYKGHFTKIEAMLNLV